MSEEYLYKEKMKALLESLKIQRVDEFMQKASIDNYTQLGEQYYNLANLKRLNNE